ncbi:MAG TPA: bacillithiol biosynthesis deacetylase BshB1 [Blastocatellia bacterium]|nr:bacillithiol biosynthesis deacetylase BshB1 [Blastocatellia bacterium]
MLELARKRARKASEEVLNDMSEAVKVDALAIGAHPDDVEFSCGGTLIKLVSLGYRVGVLDMARGELGTRGNAEIRAKEAQAAAAAMELTVRDNLELPDGHIWLTEESRVKMVRKIRRYRPKVIFTHYWEDPHPDHAHTCQIVREAAHLAGLARYDAETGQERFRPRAVAHFLFPRTVAPTFVVDVSEHAAQKQKAVECYRSQLYDPQSKELETALSSEGFLRRLEARQRFFGSLIGVDDAEAFVVREALNVHDPVELLSRRMNMYS